MSDPHLDNSISRILFAASTQTNPEHAELKTLYLEIYNLLVKEQTRRITSKANTLKNNTNYNNNMNEVTEVQTELSGIMSDTVLEFTTSNAVGIGFTTAHNKLYRIIECNLVAKATDSSPKDRYVCLVENLDSRYFDKRFFTLQFSKALKMFNSRRSMMANVETELEMKARWKTMQIPDKHIYALLRRSDSSIYKAMENYVKKHNAIQFSSNTKPKANKIKQLSVKEPVSTVEDVQIKKESNVNTPYFVYSNELDENNQLIVKLYFLLNESFQDTVFPTLSNSVKTAIYERLPVSRQETAFKKLVEKANKSYKNNG
jgi:hypothetical protein